VRLVRALLLASLAVLGAQRIFAQGSDQPSTKCSDWKAWRNVNSATYYISATCELPTPAHTVELVPAGPQGSDPHVYVLNEMVHAPEGMVAQVITPYQLHYRKKTRMNYKEFVINPGAIHVSVEGAKAKTSPSGTSPADSATEKK
jgi:hypothetical protein